MLTIPPTNYRNSYGELSDTAKLNRDLGAPEHGPKALFFSGGSALNGLSRQITDYTHNSIHLISCLTRCIRYAGNWRLAP